MKMRTLSLLTIMCLVLGAVAFAGNLYTNGPTNGTNDGYFIDVYAVSDQFPTTSGMTGFDIAEWVPSGSSPLTFDSVRRQLVLWQQSGLWRTNYQRQQLHSALHQRQPL